MCLRRLVLLPRQRLSTSTPPVGPKVGRIFDRLGFAGRRPEHAGDKFRFREFVKIEIFTCAVGHISGITPPSPCHHEGRSRESSRNVVRVAMDVAASGGVFPPDEDAAAYGEVVWSWRRDPGVYPARLC